MTWTTRPRSKSGSLAAIIAGQGPLVLLIHGVGLRAEAWNAQIAALSQTCRVHAVDMPGHGQSDALPEGSNLLEFTDRLATAIDEPAIVVGHSLGAMIALDMAIRHSDKIKGVVALNAVYRRSAAARSAVIARADSLDGKTMADPTTTLQRWFGAEPSPEFDACGRWLRTVDPKGYKSAYQLFAREDGPADDDLRRLACPALLLTGANDPNSTPRMSENMAELAPKGQAKVFADAAHMLPMTHAAPLNEVLINFVGPISERT